MLTSPGATVALGGKELGQNGFARTHMSMHRDVTDTAWLAILLSFVSPNWLGSYPVAHTGHIISTHCVHPPRLAVPLPPGNPLPPREPAFVSLACTHKPNSGCASSRCTQASGRHRRSTLTSATHPPSATSSSAAPNHLDKGQQHLRSRTTMAILGLALTYTRMPARGTGPAPHIMPSRSLLVEDGVNLNIKNVLNGLNLGSDSVWLGSVTADSTLVKRIHNYEGSTANFINLFAAGNLIQRTGECGSEGCCLRAYRANNVIEARLEFKLEFSKCDNSFEYVCVAASSNKEAYDASVAAMYMQNYFQVSVFTWLVLLTPPDHVVCYVCPVTSFIPLLPHETSCLFPFLRRSLHLPSWP